MVQNLTEEEMSLLVRAERYCANEEQCKTSVRKKLCDWGASLESSSRIVDRLCAEGFINEQRFAKAYCQSKLRIHKWGKLKVVYQLRSKQILPKYIVEGLAEVPDEEYREILKSVAQTKWDTYTESELVKRKSKLTTFLVSRGYEMPEIQNVLATFTE